MDTTPGLALVLVAVINGAFAWLIARNAGRHAKAARRAAERIDKAVNNRPEGDPTLYDIALSVERLGFSNQEMARDTNERCTRIEARVARIERRVAGIEEQRYST
jgi:hypothetical protein